jgi:hypothetical protein
MLYRRLHGPSSLPCIVVSPGYSVSSTTRSLVPSVHCWQPWICCIVDYTVRRPFRPLLSALDILYRLIQVTCSFRALLLALDMLYRRLHGPLSLACIAVSHGCVGIVYYTIPCSFRALLLTLDVLYRQLHGPSLLPCIAVSPGCAVLSAWTSTSLEF